MRYLATKKECRLCHTNVHVRYADTYTKQIRFVTEKAF